MPVPVPVTVPTVPPELPPPPRALLFLRPFLSLEPPPPTGVTGVLSSPVADLLSLEPLRKGVGFVASGFVVLIDKGGGRGCGDSGLIACDDVVLDARFDDVAWDWD